MLRLSPIYMTILTSNILLVLLTVFMLHEKIMLKVGYKLLVAFLFLTALRFLLPVEMPWCRTAALPEGLSKIVINIQHPSLQVYNYPISVWTFMKLIWLVGIIINLVRFINKIFTIHYKILLQGINVTLDEKYHKIINHICQERHKQNRFQVMELEELSSPMIHVLGRPYILVPKDFDFSDLEMYYVLSHECAHYFYHDATVKYAIKLLTIFYWWNPLVYILNKQTDILLEMRTDDTITNRGDRETFQYLQCLTHVAELAPDDFAKKDPISISFARGSKKILKRRFQMLLTRKQRNHYALGATLTGLMSIIYIISYIYTFEPSALNPNTVTGSIAPSYADTYMIQREDGSYDMYLDGIWAETLDNLDNIDYYNDIPIYTSEELVPK